MFGSIEIILILYFFLKTKKYLKDCNSSERLGWFLKLRVNNFLKNCLVKNLKREKFKTFYQ